MRTRCTAWLLLAMVEACGGPAAPVASPEATPTPEATNTPAAVAAADTTPTAPTGSDKPSVSAPASDEDIAAILQLVLNDPELDQYLHLGEPGRFPLQLAGEHLPTGLKLVKATEPVKLVDAPKSKKDAVLVITELDVQGDHATVRYRYDIEGIRANVTLAKSAHGWELKNSRLVER